MGLTSMGFASIGLISTGFAGADFTTGFTSTGLATTGFATPAGFASTLNHFDIFLAQLDTLPIIAGIDTTICPSIAAWAKTSTNLAVFLVLITRAYISCFLWLKGFFCKLRYLAAALFLSLWVISLISHQLPL